MPATSRNSKFTQGSGAARDALDEAWGSLDAWDLKVIEALQADGRASIASIAEVVGISLTGARQRVDRLLRTDTLRVIALVDPAVFGRSLVVSFRLTVEAPAREVAERVAALDEIAWVGTRADLVTVVAQASVANNEELLALVNGKIRPIVGVRSMETEFFLRIVAVPFDFGGGRRTARPPAMPRALGSDIRPVDEIDRAILHELERNARATFTAIAEAVGLSVPATRQRVRRLIGDGIVNVVARPNPMKLGRECAASLALLVSGDSSVVASRLTQMPAATFVSECAGTSDVHLELFCRDEAHLERCHAEVSALEGVSHVRVERYREVIKWLGRW